MTPGDGLFVEGGIISKIGNNTPGVNATPGLHDVFQIVLDKFGGQSLRNYLCIPGMIPAAAMTYAALMTDIQATTMILSRDNFNPYKR